MAGKDKSPGPHRGRPKSPEKRASIIAAAKALFLRDGLEAASMDGIAEAAGVSKVTVYAHFGDKESLFREVIAGESCRVHEAARALGEDGADLRTRLERLGVALLELLGRPDVQELHRLMVSQAGRDRRMVEVFYEAAPGAVHKQLADVIAAETAAGNIDVGDPSLAAELLLSMCKGLHQLRQELGLSGPLPRPDAERHVREVVRVFLRAYAPDRGR